MKNQNNHSTLKVWLTVIYVCCLLVSNIITAKQIRLPFGWTITAGIFCFPITYILSDVFSEVYGYKWSRVTCYMGFAMNLFMVGMFTLAINTEAPEYWTNQEAFETVLGNTPRILIASLAAFVVGDMANDKVFRRMKGNKGMNGFAFRAIASSFVGEIVDSAIFFPLAFAGTMPNGTIATIAITQACLKVLYEIIIIPLTTFITKKVAQKELMDNA